MRKLILASFLSALLISIIGFIGSAQPIVAKELSPSPTPTVVQVPIGEILKGIDFCKVLYVVGTFKNLESVDDDVMKAQAEWLQKHSSDGQGPDYSSARAHLKLQQLIDLGFAGCTVAPNIAKFFDSTATPTP